MKIDVEHVAKLARLGLTEQEKAKFSKDLAAILDFIGKLEKVNVKNVEPMTQATGLVNAWRQDASIKRDKASRQRILDNAPDQKDGYIKVKAVFE